MPTGLVIMRWDERTGVEVVGSYPQDVPIQDKTLMQIYSQHEYSGQAGLVTLMAGSINIASYYTGVDTGIYLVLLLQAEEDGDIYEEGLVEMSRVVIQNLDSSSFTTLLPPLFQRLSVYPTLTEEQSLALFLSSDVKRLILKRLREEALITKSEIAIWLKDVYEEGFVDVESLISSILKIGVGTIASIKGLSSDVLFFTTDILMIKVPPVQLISDPVGRHLPESLKELYITEVKNYFQNYFPTEKENIDIANQILLDPEVYEVLKLMREAIVTRNDLEKLKKKGVEDVDRVLKEMYQLKMIEAFQDDAGNEYFCLITDIYITTLFPKYNLDTIRKQYNMKSVNNQILIKALELMKSNYLELSKSEKKSNKVKAEA